MKKTILLILLCCPLTMFAQGQQATLLGQWDDPTIIGSTAYNNRYNEVWSVAVNGHEYGIIGSTRGTHFIDVTNPSAPFEAAFVPGKAQGGSIIHRDYKTYKNYVYGVCDEGPSSLQIMDVSTLPDSVRLVYNSNSIIVTAHNISIDTATGMLYAWVFGGSPQYGYGGMALLSLANPENPTYVRKYNNVQGFSFGHIHDGFVRNDTVYLDAGTDGFAIADFSTPQQPKLLGTMTSYPGQGYNHSGWLSEDGRYYYMADENHGSPVKTVDVQNLEDIQVVDSYHAYSTPTQIPHNPLLACNYLYVAYYYDGLQVYDVSDPENVNRVLYYDTSTEPDGTSYKGAWGVNPFLPSGNILIADMQNGLFIFKGIGDGCTGAVSATKQAPEAAFQVKVSPQPAVDVLQVKLENLSYKQGTAQLFDAGMRQVCSQVIEQQEFKMQIPAQLANGLYLLKIETDAGVVTKKVSIFCF
ncbi:MAG: choice-of-anchor B family protein [Saprospiraceae bacterium]|nr:choice-of-anchor B family protein [Saprospiraceae bacterium]